MVILFTFTSYNASERTITRLFYVCEHLYLTNIKRLNKPFTLQIRSVPDVFRDAYKTADIPNDHTAKTDK